MGRHAFETDGERAEMARHAELRIDHDLPVYFRDPHSPLSADLHGKSPVRRPAGSCEA